MRRRLILSFGAVILIAVAAVLGSAVPRILGPVIGTPAPPPAPVEPTPEGGPQRRLGQMQISVSSSDVPGCFEEGQPFQAILSSRWRGLESRDVVVFRWSRAPDGAGGVVVRADGKTKQVRLDLGERFPDVNLKLPLGEVTTEVKLTTFVFERWDASGKACFGWAQPPGTPRPHEVNPVPREALRHDGTAVARPAVRPVTHGWPARPPVGSPS
jgi:hypothetical protein